MKAPFRTSLAVISIAGAMTLLSGFMVAYGGTKMARGDLLVNYPLWPIFILATGITGVLLIISKGRALPPFVDPKKPGYLALPPLAIIVTVSAYLRVGPALAFFVLALPAAYYALKNDEPEPEAGMRDLNDFLGIGTLLLFGIFSAAFPEKPPLMSPAVALAMSAAIALPAAYFCWRSPSGRHARVSRFAVGAALIAVSAIAILSGNPVYALFYLPLGTLLVLHPILGAMRLGTVSDEGLTDENIVVNQFEKIAELTVWSVYVFTLIHAYFNPPGLSNALFFLFIAGFLVFTIEYEMVSKRKATYEFSQKKSIANAVLLSVIAHLTGGFQSPYVWFFILVLTSGAFVPKPKLILDRLYVIVGFYAIETMYYAYYGALNETMVIDHLMPQLFVIGLAGVYSYRLALRRRQLDENMMDANDDLKRALEGERSAKAVIEHQAYEIAQAKRRDETMLASLADAVIGLDETGHITSLNPAAEGLLGVSSDEALRKHLRDIVMIRREEDQKFNLGAYMDAALKGNAVPLPEDVFIDKGEGRKAYLTGVFLPSMDETKKVTGIVVTMSDITYTHEVEQMKTGFLSVAAHQLRTPLSTIRWYLELLNDPSEGKLKKNQKMFAENAYLSLRKMVGLVNRLLAVTRLEAGRVPFKPEPTDLKAMTADILDVLKPKLSERKLEVRADLQPLPAVPLDPTLAREVFVNLIENAIRYTPDGGRIDIEASDEGNEIGWSGTDTGIGIPKAQQEKIFGKFFRAANAIEHSSEGSGLGLYLAKFIVDVWGGKISFVSTEGKGTKFGVTIPKQGMKSKTGQVSLNA